MTLLLAVSTPIKGSLGHSPSRYSYHRACQNRCAVVNLTGPRLLVPASFRRLFETEPTLVRVATLAVAIESKSSLQFHDSFARTVSPWASTFASSSPYTDDHPGLGRPWCYAHCRAKKGSFWSVLSLCGYMCNYTQLRREARENWTVRAYHLDTVIAVRRSQCQFAAIYPTESPRNQLQRCPLASCWLSRSTVSFHR